MEGLAPVVVRAQAAGIDPVLPIVRVQVPDLEHDPVRLTDLADGRQPVIARVLDPAQAIDPSREVVLQQEIVQVVPAQVTGLLPEIDRHADRPVDVIPAKSVRR